LLASKYGADQVEVYMDRLFILNQAFEESRYHRRFHHVVYTLFMTLYLAFLGFQISFPSNIEAVRGQTTLAVILGICIFLLIPLYICYVVLTYHKTIARLNSLIANINIPLDSDLDLSVKSSETFRKALATLLFGKYKGVIANNRNPILVGRGHWFFLVTFLLLVVCDFLVFMLIRVPVSG